MSSFYGCYGSSSTGTGTSDYNELANRPFINITGTQENPIVLNSLGYGNYVIKGFFMYVTNGNLKNTSQLLVSITQDKITLKKTSFYETIENEKLYFYTVIFNDDGTCLINKESINKTNGTIFIGESELPTIGSENILYITENNIYQWRNGAYILMNNNSQQWENF